MSRLLCNEFLICEDENDRVALAIKTDDVKKFGMLEEQIKKRHTDIVNLKTQRSFPNTIPRVELNDMCMINYG